MREFLKANPDIADEIESQVRGKTAVVDEQLGSPEPDEGQPTVEHRAPQEADRRDPPTDPRRPRPCGPEARHRRAPGSCRSPCDRPGGRRRFLLWRPLLRDPDAFQLTPGNTGLAD